jgi:hypothetical protein
MVLPHRYLLGPATLISKVIMLCNTTSGQSVYFTYSPSQSFGVSGSVLLRKFGAASSFTAPYNITSAVWWWVLTVENLFYVSATELLNLNNITLWPNYLLFDGRVPFY